MKSFLLFLSVSFAMAWDKYDVPYAEEVKHLSLKIEEDKKMRAGLY